MNVIWKILGILFGNHRSLVFLIAMTSPFLLTGCFGGDERATDLVPKPEVTPNPEPEPEPEPEPTVTPTPIPTPSANISQCTTRVLDPGSKGTAAGHTRGSFVALDTVPGTDSPAMAYADGYSTTAGHAVIGTKFSWWNGLAYTTEVVSGDGAAAASFIKLAFLANKTPIIVYASGNLLRAAIRSAPLPSVGTWSVGTIDSGSTTAPRAIDVSVSPLDQVSISYVGTFTTLKLRWVACQEGCNSLSSYSLAGHPDATAIVANTAQTGTAWCKKDANTYLPAIVFPTTGGIKYSICNSSTITSATTLNACGGTWATTIGTTVTVDAVTTSTNAELYIDSSIDGSTEVPKVSALFGATGIKNFKNANGCEVAPIAFTAAAAVVNGSAGHAGTWLTLDKDAAGKFHILTQFGTTVVKYFNSTTTDINAVWNAPGTVETVTLPAAGAGSFGASMNLAKNKYYMAYPRAVAPFNFRLAVVNSTATASSAATFIPASPEPDSTGAIQLLGTNAPQQNIAMASTSDLRPAVAYVDYSVGAQAAAKLKYSVRDAGGGFGKLVNAKFGHCADYPSTPLSISEI